MAAEPTLINEDYMRPFPRIKRLDRPDNRERYKWLRNVFRGAQVCGVLHENMERLPSELSLFGGCPLQDAALVHLHRVGRFGSKFKAAIRRDVNYAAVHMHKHLEKPKSLAKYPPYTPGSREHYWEEEYQKPRPVYGSEFETSLHMLWEREFRERQRTWTSAMGKLDSGKGGSAWKGGNRMAVDMFDYDEEIENIFAPAGPQQKPMCKFPACWFIGTQDECEKHETNCHRDDKPGSTMCNTLSRVQKTQGVRKQWFLSHCDACGSGHRAKRVRSGAVDVCRRSPKERNLSESVERMLPNMDCSP